MRRALVRTLRVFDYELCRMTPFNAEKRERGLDWPAFGYSIIGLDGFPIFRKKCHLRPFCGKTFKVISSRRELGVAGPASSCARFCEPIIPKEQCGLRIVLKDFQGPRQSPDRELARLKPDSYDQAGNPYLAVSLGEVQENFRRFGLLDYPGEIPQRLV